MSEKLKIEFKNGSKLVFENIDNEEYRIYEFIKDDGKPYNVKIIEPLKMHVNDLGDHRIFDREETSHYIPFGWVHLKWKTKKGKEHFR